MFQTHLCCRLSISKWLSVLLKQPVWTCSDSSVKPVLGQAATSHDNVCVVLVILCVWCLLPCGVGVFVCVCVRPAFCVIMIVVL